MPPQATRAKPRAAAAPAKAAKRSKAKGSKVARIVNGGKAARRAAPTTASATARGRAARPAKKAAKTPSYRVHLGISDTSLPGLPAVTLLASVLMNSGEFISVASAANSVGPTLDVALVDEQGSFVSPWAEYARVRIFERAVLAIVSPECLRLLAETRRMTTSLFLALGGTKFNKVLAGVKFTKHL
jgi:hypothetical protein